MHAARGDDKKIARHGGRAAQDGQRGEAAAGLQRGETAVAGLQRGETAVAGRRRGGDRLEQGGLRATRSYGIISHMTSHKANRPIARYRRFAGYDYSRGASLFVTIVTSPRRALFGAVRDAAMIFSPFGAEVEAALVFTFAKASGLRLYGRVVMPDHIHFRLYLEPGLSSDRAIALLNQIIGRFKSYTTHLYQTKYGGHGALWQQGYHDWLCLSREMIDAVERYIGYNALKWELRHNCGNLLKLHEPILSPRLGEGEFWRGVGAIELLEIGRRGGRPAQDGGEAAARGGRPAQDGGEAAARGGRPAQDGGEAAVRGGAAAQDGGEAAARGGAAAQDGGRLEQPDLRVGRSLVALRVSRRCSPADVAALKGRLLAKAANLTIVSGFISGGEREILAALLAEPKAALVKVSPYALAHDYQPGVALMPAIGEGRLAVIARGNSPEEISRAACLDLNARIIDIADRAAYALPGEVRWLK